MGQLCTPRASPHNLFTGRPIGVLLSKPELARDGADGVIDRSQDARHSESPSGLFAKRSPSCLELASRNPSWQRSCATATTDRTYDRNRFDPYSAPNLASRGPSTYGTWSGARPRWFERPCALQRMIQDRASLAGVTRSFLSQSSEFPRRPVIVPAGRNSPEPPGSGLYRSARGHRTRSAFGSTLGRRRPSPSEIRWRLCI